jgi:adenylate cyclase
MVVWKVFIAGRLDLPSITDKFASAPGLATRTRGVHNARRMGREIERKFLVASEQWRPAVTSSRTLRQGYLAIDGGNTVRVRIDGEQSWLTIKGRGQGMVRPEFEYAVPPDDARELLELCRGRTIEKTRHLIPCGHLLWEIDEFGGGNAGLVVAEIELPSENAEFPRPDWLGEEVTGEPRFLNANLAVHPYELWAR